MRIDKSLLPESYTLDPNQDGLFVEFHPDGQLKTVALHSDGKAVGQSLHLDPGELRAQLVELKDFVHVEDVADAAQDQYATWVAMAVNSIVDRANFVTRCDFCGKSSSQVPRVIAGPTSTICSECIQVCNQVLEAS